VLELVDEGVALEDVVDEWAALELVDEGWGYEPGPGTHGDLGSSLHPVIAVPTTIVATAQPTMETRASSMGIPSASIHVNPRLVKCRHRVVQPRRLTLLGNFGANKGSAGSRPMLAWGGAASWGEETIMAAAVARAVRFDRYGGRDVLYVADIDMPSAGPGEVVVEVRAAGINPGEAAIRTGALHDMFPATFPSGEGSDLAGVVTTIGPEVTEFCVGDEVLGFSFRRSSHATHTAVPANQLIHKPPQMSWEVAGSLYVVGATAYAAVQAVAPRPGETVAVSAAAGGVGSLVVQLLVRHKAVVLGIAGPGNADWLRGHGVIPIAYGEDLQGLARRLREAAPNGIDAFIDLFGPDYVQLAVDLGVAPERIDTIISFQKAAEVGAKMEGSAEASTPEVLTEIADLVASGALEFEVAATYPLDRVADAYEELEKRHTHGKIVLLPKGSP